MSNKNHDHKDILGHSDQLNQQAPQDLSRKDKSEPSYSTIQSLREALDQ